MAEQEGKGPLEKPIDWFSGWKASFERTRQRFGTLVAVLLSLSVAGGPIWWNWDDIVKRPVVEPVVEWFNQKALPTAQPGRLTIAVAHLERDKDREHERLVRDGLREFEGAEVVRVDRTVDPDQPDEKKAEEEARGLLKKTGADVLIWGREIACVFSMGWLGWLAAQGLGFELWRKAYPRALFKIFWTSNSNLKEIRISC